MIFNRPGRSAVLEECTAMVSQMNRGEPFSFARYGDGEFNAIFQVRPGAKNCDGHSYFPSMGAELERSLDEPRPYHYGLQRAGVMTSLQEQVEARWGDIPWRDAAAFHYASIFGHLFPVVAALKQKKVLMVGPRYLKDLPFVNGGHVVIPEVNCYREKDRILADIRGMLQSRGAQVVAFSASMVSDILIYELYPEYGEAKWLIDFGSVWEPYVGRQNRTYHKNFTREQLERNLNG
jgi:hypothetical protein